MNRTIYISIIINLFVSFSYGQNIHDFHEDLTDKSFIKLKKRSIPRKVIKLLGYDTYRVIGTKMKQTGCTSGKRIALNWAVTDKNGLYVIKVSTCGAWSESLYYIISEGERYDIKLDGNIESFKSFRKEYFNLFEK